MGWKMWIVFGVMVLGFVLNAKDVWSPKAVHRDEEETRKLAFASLFIQAFFIYAILEMNRSVE
jgi:hypothetical protein